MDERTPERFETMQRANARSLGLVLAVVVLALLALPVLLRVV